VPIPSILTSILVPGRMEPTPMDVPQQIT
ncbi:uncharacterized protein METZ01_LOCUS387025, partial [marine metagenome]